MRLISFQAPFQTTTSVGEMRLGEEAITPDGRAWKWVQLQSSATAGCLVSPSPSPAFQTTLAAGTLTASANPVGQVVYITYSTGGLTAGALEDGWIYLYIGTGEGTLMKVKTNSATRIEVYPGYALSATTSIDATTGAKTWHPNAVIPTPITTQTQVVTGVVQTTFAALAYGWALIRGYGTVLGSSLVAGHGFGPGGADCGLWFDCHDR